jgi:hypothetical protein
MVSTVLGGVSYLMATSPTSTLVIAALILVLIVAKYFGTGRVDSQEPPLAPTSIPFIGHLIGIIRHQNQYFDILR